VPSAGSPTPGVTASEAGDDDVEETDDCVDDGCEDSADPVDDGHEACADGLEDGLDARNNGTHFDGCWLLVVLGLDNEGFVY